MLGKKSQLDILNHKVRVIKEESNFDNLFSDIVGYETADVKAFKESLSLFVGSLGDAVDYLNDNWDDTITPTKRTVELLKSLNHAGNSSIADLLLDIYQSLKYQVTYKPESYTKFFDKSEVLIVGIEHLARDMMFIFLKDNYYNIRFRNTIERHLFLEKDLRGQNYKTYNVTQGKGVFKEVNKNGGYTKTADSSGLFDVISHHRLYNVSLVEDESSKREIYNLIDLAIDTRDKSWFNELVKELNDGESIRTT